MHDRHHILLLVALLALDSHAELGGVSSPNSTYGGFPIRQPSFSSPIGPPSNARTAPAYELKVQPFASIGTSGSGSSDGHSDYLDMRYGCELRDYRDEATVTRFTPYNFFSWTVDMWSWDLWVPPTNNADVTFKEQDIVLSGRIWDHEQQSFVQPTLRIGYWETEADQTDSSGFRGTPEVFVGSHLWDDLMIITLNCGASLCEHTDATFYTSLRGQLRVNKKPYMALIVTGDNYKTLNEDAEPSAGLGLAIDSEYFAVEVLCESMLYKPLDAEGPQVSVKLSHFVTLALSYFVSYSQNYVVTNHEIVETVPVFSTGMAIAF